ncbi:hypothetical protein cand_002900 [Cryptosporidium andersoni]|uniref:Uncharacterized protein n=1 Tax=Cryptosporidium andersoni TaxID=117008 RepID=A0A1J4MNW3_9CRYT|nr:hypothetical protein cand_002900 [Cryptosporidium andersoni]
MVNILTYFILFYYILLGSALSKISINTEDNIGIDLNKKSNEVEEILYNIGSEPSINEYIDEDSFLKFKTDSIRYFNIEDIPIGEDQRDSKFQRIIQSGIKFAEYSRILSKKEHQNTVILIGDKKKRIEFSNNERDIASSAILASIIMLRSLLYKELSSNIRWIYAIYFPLLLKAYEDASNRTSIGNGILSRGFSKRYLKSLGRLNRALTFLTKNVNKIVPSGEYSYKTKPLEFWDVIESLIVTPAHGLLNTDVISDDSFNPSRQYLDEVISLFRSKKYKIAMAQNNAKTAFYYFLNKDAILHQI